MRMTGDIIKKYREKMGYTLQQTASAIGTPETLEYEKIEIGEIELDVETIEVLSEILDISTWEKIKLFRESRGYYQRDLAKMVGTTQSVISNLETGAQPLSKELRERILQALDLPEGSLKISITSHKENSKENKNLKRTGEIIRRRREEQGYTRKQLAEAVGISESLEYKIETGKSLLKVELVEMFAEVLSIPTWEKIKLFREAREFSQQDLANMIGIDRAVLSKIETGVQKLSKEIMERLLTALDLPKGALKIVLEPKANKNNRLHKLSKSDLMAAYNNYRAVIIRLLKKKNENDEELFPAILDYVDWHERKLVAIYGYERNRVLHIEDYNVKWIAYAYDEDLLDEEKVDF